MGGEFRLLAFDIGDHYRQPGVRGGDGEDALLLAHGVGEDEVRGDDPQAGVAADAVGLLSHHPAELVDAGEVGLGVFGVPPVTMFVSPGNESEGFEAEARV